MSNFTIVKQPNDKDHFTVKNNIQVLIIVILVLLISKY